MVSPTLAAWSHNRRPEGRGVASIPRRSARRKAISLPRVTLYRSKSRSAGDASVVTPAQMNSTMGLSINRSCRVAPPDPWPGSSRSAIAGSVSRHEARGTAMAGPHTTMPRPNGNGIAMRSHV